MQEYNPTIQRDQQYIGFIGYSVCVRFRVWGLGCHFGFDANHAWQAVVCGELANSM